jgi:ADP-heptose:LPS heptosyltransferase
MDPWQQLSQDPEREQQMIAQLRERRFDGAVIFTSFRQSSLPSAYLCYLAGIPLRLAASIDGPGSLLTTRHKHPERMMHEVERGLDLIGAIGLGTQALDLVLRPRDEDRRQAAEIVAPFRRPIVVVHPGCSMPARTYPWEMFAQACDLLIERLNATVVLTGVESERDLAARIRARMQHEAVDLAGELPFGVFCALIEAADLTVTNNTGPMHVSAALKTPVVALFALTNPPEQWGPWRVPHRQLFREVPCRLCYHHVCPYHHECLDIAPDEVVAATRELLGEVGVLRPVAAEVGG